MVLDTLRKRRAEGGQWKFWPILCSGFEAGR